MILFELRLTLLFFALFGLLPITSGWSQEGKPRPPVVVNTREALVRAVGDAVAGTKILIAPGEYRGGLSFTAIEGTAGQPIVLAALDPMDPPQFVGGNSCLHLRRPRHVQLHHLVLRDATGNGLNVDDGGDADRPASHLLLTGLQVHDIGPKGNRDGIKLSGVDHFSITRCRITRWGDSGSAIDMVGCHQGDVTECHFEYRGDISANGVQTKGGSADVRIRGCRFENAGGRAVNLGGSTGKDYFRPRNANYEAKNIHVTECTFIGSMAPIVFVGVDGAIVRNNTIYRPTKWVVRILQESQGAEFVPCRNGNFENNLVAFRSDEARTIVNVGGGTAVETFSFSGNHWYCIDAPQRSDRLSLPVPETNGTYGVDPQFIDAAAGDLRLKTTSPVTDD